MKARFFNEPSGYAREELYEMLRLIRLEEKRQNWKVPEPSEAELTKPIEYYEEMMTWM